MNLTLNGENIVSGSHLLANLIEELSLPIEGIAIAINDEVISKSTWSETELSEGDKILVITATQGG